MRVLEIGPGPKPQAQIIWPDAEIKTMDADSQWKPNYVHEAHTIPQKAKGQFDAVFASHILEHIPYWDTLAVLTEWGTALADNGQRELHIAVPSLEWSAEQILSENPSPALFGHMIGGLTTPYDVHMAGFTMRKLRSVMDQAGYRVTRARTGPYPIVGMDGKVHEAEQHYVMGVRR